MYMYDIIEFNVLWMNEIFIHFFYILLQKIYLDNITRCGSRKEGCESGVGSVHYMLEYVSGGPSSGGCGPGISLGGGIRGTGGGGCSPCCRGIISDGGNGPSTGDLRVPGGGPISPSVDPIGPSVGFGGPECWFWRSQWWSGQSRWRWSR